MTWSVIRPSNVVVIMFQFYSTFLLPRNLFDFKLRSIRNVYSISTLYTMFKLVYKLSSFHDVPPHLEADGKKGYQLMYRMHV